MTCLNVSGKSLALTKMMAQCLGLRHMSLHRMGGQTGSLVLAIVLLGCPVGSWDHWRLAGLEPTCQVLHNIVIWYYDMLYYGLLPWYPSERARAWNPWRARAWTLPTECPKKLVSSKENPCRNEMFLAKRLRKTRTPTGFVSNPSKQRPQKVPERHLRNALTSYLGHKKCPNVTYGMP